MTRNIEQFVKALDEYRKCVETHDTRKEHYLNGYHVEAWSEYGQGYINEIIDAGDVLQKTLDDIISDRVQSILKDRGLTLYSATEVVKQHQRQVDLDSPN